MAAPERVKLSLGKRGRRSAVSPALVNDIRSLESKFSNEVRD
jgi:hypothetical protein